MLYISFVYALLVQDRVIEGVKHVEAGSASFNMYFLTEMTKNKKAIAKQLLGKDFNIPLKYVTKLINVIGFADDSGLLKASRNFLSVHNKGRYPADPTAFEQWKDFINEHSYFGQLMNPLFQIQKDINKVIEDEKENVSDNAELQAVLASLGIS